MKSSKLSAKAKPAKAIGSAQLGQLPSKSSTQKRRRGNQDIELQFETLEPRQMLAGNVGALIFQATFEDANVPVGEFRAFGNVSGFTATGDPVEVQHNFPAVGPASQGEKLLELDGANGVFVNIADVPSSGLLLHGDYSPRRFFNSFQNTIEVLWNGTVVKTLSEDGRGQDSTDFQLFELVLSGENSSGRLEFRSITPNDEFGAGGLLDDIKVFKLNGRPPVLQPISNRTVDENETISVQLEATDPDSRQDQLRFAAVRKPATATLDPITGEFRWTPNSFAAGRQFSIEVGVSDESGFTDTKTFRISVTDVPGDNPPNLQAISNRTVIQNNPVRIQLVATDTDSSQNQLTFSATQSPVGSTINPTTGLFEWTPNEFAAGRRFHIALGVTDQTGLTDTVTFKVTVNDGSETLPPVLQAISDRTMDEGNPISIQLVATDPDSEQSQLRFSALRSPVGSTLDLVTGLFQWTPNRFTGGLTFGIDVQVADEAGLTDTQTFRIAVNDVEGGQAPKLQTIGDQTIDEGDPLVIQLIATDQDSDQDQLRYAALRSPIGSTLDPITGEFQWTPNSFAGGLRFGIDVQVTDETGLTDKKTFRVNVSDIPAGTPVLGPISDQTIRETEPLSIQLSATDSDSDQSQLRYSALRAPQGATLDPVTGEFVWTPNAFAGGHRFGIAVRVTDETGLSDTQTFRVTVENLNAAPILAAIDDQTVDRNEQLSFTATATDADRPAETLTFRLTGNIPTGAMIDPATGRFNWTPTDNTSVGLHMFNVVVDDGTGNEDSQQINIHVSSGNNESLDLVEGTRFETAASQTILITEDTKQLSFNYEPTFDLADVDFINDAFEVALLDDDGNSLVHTTGFKRDSFFNVTEEKSTAAGVNTEIDGATVKLDLSHIAPGTTANLVFRLVNNDDDTETKVRVTSIATSGEAMLTPIGAAADPREPRNTTPIDFDSLSDVTGSLSIEYGETSLNRTTDSLFSQIELTNIGQVAVSGRMLAVFENPTSEQVQLINPEGRLPDGRFFIELNTENGMLAAGETTQLRDLVISNPESELFDFDLKILAEANSAPTGFISIPPSVMEAGQTLHYTAVAIDPDEGQSLTYSVVVGHENISIAEVTGELSWPTTVDEIGSHAVTLRATDPFGLFVEQSFTIDVQDSLQNRPPNFVTDPVTDAIASSGFEITTVATGVGPTGVSVVNGFLGPGLVTLNTGDQSLSQIDSLGNDRFDLPTQVSVGEPAPTGQVLRSGYSVDVGLPAFEHTGDSNLISGMDQADLNGDGILDLVVSGFVHQERPSRTYRQVINVTFGNPDGTFGEAITVGELPAASNSKYSTLRVADLDNDGYFDILTTDRQTSTMSFLRGDGQGAFADTVSSTLATNLYNFKSVDLNQDGNLDLVGMSNAQKEFGYMLGSGDGSFDDFVTIYGDPAGPLIPLGAERNYAVADMDGDSDIDVVLSQYRERNIKVLLNDGDLDFSVAATLDALHPFYQYSTPGPPNVVFAVFAGDFNGDSHADIAYGSLDGSSSHTGGLGVYLGDGSGVSFTYQDGADAIIESPNNAAGNGDAVDIDNDGDLDIVVASSRGGTSSAGQMPSVLINRGDGTFSTQNLTVPAFGESSYAFINNEANAKGVLVGDYNQDGLPDISIYRSERSFASVTVVLADQPGAFASSSSLLYEISAPQDFFEAGDFNNDGIVDLWSPQYQGISQTWLGQGGGAFDEPFPATPYIGNEFLGKGTVEDFNQDGNLDVFWMGDNGVQNGPAPRYLAALGNGDGTFEITFQERLIGSGARRPDWSDFNGDGYLDFAANSLEGVQVFLYDVDNPGTWVFNNELLFSGLGAGGRGYGHAMSIDDFDQDGNADIGVVSRLTDEPFRLVVYPGLGDGTFTSPVSTHFAEGASDYTSPNWMSTGDFNEDGIPDVAIYEYYSISVHLGVGDGTFGRTDIYPAWRTANSETQLFVRDVNQDGHDDVMFTDWQGSQSLGILLGKGDGSFQDRIAYDVPTQGGVPAFGDFDNDGREDIVLPGARTANYATILYGARERLTDIVSVDLNGDGNDDVLATNTDNSRVKWFLGDNLGNLNRQPDLFTDFGPVALTVSDLDSDGVTEIITVNRSARSISIFTGGVEIWTRNDVSVGQAPVDVLSGFLNGDTSPDLLVIDEVNDALWVLSGNGDMTFSEPVAVPLGDRPNDLLLADVDGDGNNDVVLSLPDSGRIMILPGDGQGGFTDPLYVTLEGSPGEIAAVDFNQDGNLDLAATLSDLDQVAIIFGRGQNQFARPQLISVGDNPVAMTAEDADDDGRIDLIVTNQGDDTVSVIYNRFDPNEVYRYDADAIDPDGDSLTYAIVDGPGGLIINSETGALLWAASPDQVGQHTVTLSADDGRGGVATQTFKIDVQPARENSIPLFATEADTTMGANEVFTYLATALDNDNDAIRYRLLDAPDGATIDPTTGLVTWDGRAEALKFNEFGQNGFVEAIQSESYKTPSVTVEGWYKIDTLTASNGAALLFEHLTDSGHHTFRVQTAFNKELQLLTYASGIGTSRARFDFFPEVDRWYHFAMTVDDATRLATLLVDGESIGSFEMPGSLEYGVNRSLTIGGSQTTVDNFRAWSVARTHAEIQQGMAEQYDDNPLVTVDYRFNESGSYSVYDSSIYHNDGYFGLGVSTVVPRPDAGLVDPGERSFTISVEDGRGGFDTQTFVLEVLPELRGSIAGHLFDDLNGDGDQDDGSEDGVPAEPPLAGWQLYVDTNGNSYPDPGELQTPTDAEGNYRFDRLLPGDYPVRVFPVAAYDIPTEPSNLSVTANVESVFDLAFEQLSLSHIRGQLQGEDGEAIAYWKTYADLDEDGTRDVDEPMAISDREGNFALTGLGAGTYTIRTELPAGWSDTAGSDGLTVALASDEISSGNDFVLKPTNTSVTGGVHFVTTPPTKVTARKTLRYASVATAILNQEITYDLSLAPEGVTIEPTNGLVAWRPTIDQIGEHLIVLRATDVSGSVSLQDFTVTVAAPNTDPVIVSNAPLVGFVGKTFVYDVDAQDAEGQSISYDIITGPTSATIDPATGQLRWTPAVSAMGSTLFEIEVRDESGGVSTQQFTVVVSPDSAEAIPFKIEFPRLRVGLGQAYVAYINGVDQLDRPLVWTLTNGPSGMTITEAGSFNWNAGSGNLGVQPVELLATNVDGEMEILTFDLSVEGRPVISTPDIISTPVLSTVIGQPYSYDVLVDDADNDVLAFALLAAPVGMSINPSKGTIRWIADTDQRGETDILIEVTDPDGASTTQAYSLRVSFAGGPPKTTSTPPTEVNVGRTLLYTVIAEDREDDPLTYRLLTAPAGATITETTGEISWTPTAGQLGLQAIVIEVSDGIGGAATQAFSIRVSDGVINLSPIIQSSAPRFTAVGSDYSYQITATDPESTNLSFSVGRGPDGLTVDNNGLVIWSPAVGQTGQFVVTLVVTDEGGASAIESFELDVLAENRQPVVTSTAPVSTTKGAKYRYDVLVSDADLDPLTFELVTGPANASINAFGQVDWSNSEAELGNYDFEVRVSDPRGGETTQSFTVELAADTEAPKISVISNPGEGINSPWSGPFVVYVKAADNVEIASLTLSANGEDIPLSGNGTAVFTFEDWTFRTITATGTAIDSSGNVTTQTIAFDYDIPEGWSGVGGDEIPTAIISTPSDAESVTGMVSIVGTASHEDFDTYRLSYRHVSDAGFTEILQSNSSVENGELGVWDTSLLRNDEYVIRLEVATSAGVPNVVEQNVGLAGELKLGNFQLSFTDMVIPVAGIPIQITRVYDTLQSDVEGEFGFGWRLEFRDTQLQVGLPKSGLEDIGIYPALRSGVKVYLNVPGEGRQGFTFNPDIRVLPGTGGNNLVLGRPRFTPDPGVTSRLSTGISNYLLVNDYGELFAPGGIPYNPASPDFGGAYVVTTEDGTVYGVNGATGQLDRATDRNGNRLTFTESGISADGVGQVVFQQDAQGRIRSVLDLEGKAIQYGYDNAGNLNSVTDREGHETTFTYSIERQHYLETVVDPLGREGARTNYDENGRLIGSRNVRGAETTFTFDPDNFVAEVSGQGNTLIYEYDNFGNVVSITDLEGNQYRNEFDSNSRLISTSDPQGTSTTFRRDGQGNAFAITDARGATTRFTYDAEGNVLSQVNAIGQRDSFVYDNNGNLIQMTDAAGFTSTREYDSAGNAISVTDSNGSSKTRAFDHFGNVISDMDAFGNERRFAFDGNGQQTGNSADVLLASGETVELSIEFELDSNGNRLTTTGPDGSTVTQTYNALGQTNSITDQTGLSTNISGTDTPTPTRVDVPGGKSVEFEYSLGNDATRFTNLNGQIERYEYDLAGNLVRRFLADDSPADDTDNPFFEYQYSSTQRITATIDPNGNRTEFEYDSTGNVVLTRDAIDGETISEYDLLGRLTGSTSPQGKKTSFVYDARGYLQQTTFADGNTIEQAFDQIGNRISSTDALGAVTQFAYDAENRVSVIVDANANRTEYERDQFGNVIVQRDALGRETTYEYDEFLRQTATVRPLGQRSETSYSIDNKLNVLSDFSDNETTYHYNDAGRLDRISYADGTESAFALDGEGNVTQIVDARGTTMLTYDAQQRLTEKIEPDGRFVRYEYDAASNIVSLTSPSGATAYTYDPLNRLETVTAANSEVTTYQYDADGNNTDIAFGNGTAEVREFDSLNRLVQTELFDANGDLILRTEHQRDAIGSLTRTEDSDGRVSTYVYDANLQLMEESHQSPMLPIQTIRYVYDQVGNRIQKQDSLAGTTNYTYDQNDRLVSTSGIENQTLTYDANGNLLESFTDALNRTEYQFDVRGRLVQVDATDQGTTKQVNYEYDHAGNRITRTDAAGEVRFLFDANRRFAEVVEEYHVDGTTLAKFIVANKVIGQTLGSDAYYIHKGASQNVYALTDAAGDSAGGYLYDGFGGVLEDTVSLENRYQFAGEYSDSVTGLTYLRARHLDNSTGRFVSADPFAGIFDDPRSLHRYTYAHNNPTNFTDPSGEFTLAEQVGVLSVAGIAITLTQQILSFVEGVTQTVNFSGSSTGFSLDFAGVPNTGAEIASASLSAGLQLNVAATHQAPQQDNPRDYSRSNIGGSLTAFGSASISLNALGFLNLPGIGIGGFSVEVPQLFVPRLFPSASLAGGFLQLSITAADIVGKTLVAPVFMGFGAGDASGLTFALLVGIEGSAIAGVTAPIFGQDSSFSDAERVRNFLS